MEIRAMNTASEWQSRPVFVSSTFLDMQAERDHLQDVVWPELAERLRERRHELIPVDLRWGVETYAIDEVGKREVHVLKVCLQEITRSRPFMIVLLGDRYGWIPSHDRMAAAASEMGFTTDMRGKSVTALEIEFGILKNPPQAARSFFYLRRSLPRGQMSPETAARYFELADDHGAQGEAAERLDAMKAKIRDVFEPLGRVREYTATWDAEREKVTGLEEWGRMVLEDLWGEIEPETRVFARKPPISWEDEERRALDDFINLGSRSFLGREDVQRELLVAARDQAPSYGRRGICLTGESGAGKSALFAKLATELREIPDLLVLANSAGIGVRSTSIDAILRRWVTELAATLREESPIDDESAPSEVCDSFEDLSARVSTKIRVVILLDALNELEDLSVAQEMTWLPPDIPAGLFIIATSVPCNASAAWRVLA